MKRDVIDVDLLWEIIDKHWPHHIEGTGGTGAVKHTYWDVIDPAIPSREWLQTVVDEYAVRSGVRRGVQEFGGAFEKLAEA